MGKGILLTTFPRGGLGVTCPGVKAYLIHSGAGLIKAICVLGVGGGGPDSMRVPGVEGSENKCGPQDNFWNSPYQF